MKWVLLIVAVFVCASPIDLWPDVMPFGSLDDMAFAVAAVQAFEKACQKRLGSVIDATVVEA